MPSKMHNSPPKPGECLYAAKFGNFCHRPGLPEQNGLCYWHSPLPKTREKFIEEHEEGGSFEGVVIQGLDLSNLNLHQAELRGFTANLCTFDYSDLSRSFMDMAIFVECNFMHSDLNHIHANFTKFTNCYFYEANLESADLQQADLSNSGFDKANLRDAHIGLGGMIVVSGIGNPEQHRTRIEGASFQGADFQDIHLDESYRNAQNLQEPLKRVWLHEIKSQLQVAKSAATNDDKKKSLEILTQTIINRIPDLTVRNRDKRRLTDEIDLIVMNKSLALLAAGLGGPIFIECKNENKPVGSGVVKKLSGTMPHGGVGLIVTAKTLSKDAQQEMSLQMLANAARGLRLTFWDGEDLEDIVNGEEPEERLIERYYYILGL